MFISERIDRLLIGGGRNIAQEAENTSELVLIARSRILFIL